MRPDPIELLFRRRDAEQDRTPREVLMVDGKQVREEDQVEIRGPDVDGHRNVKRVRADLYERYLHNVANARAR